MAAYKFNITIHAPSGGRTIDVRDYILKVMESGRLKVSGVKFVPTPVKVHLENGFWQIDKRDAKNIRN